MSAVKVLVDRIEDPHERIETLMDMVAIKKKKKVNVFVNVLQ